MDKNIAIIVTGIHNEVTVTWAIDVAANRLRGQGLEIEILRMHWSTIDDYFSKEKELLDLIEEKSKSRKVSLIGISAGAVTCLNAMAKTDKINKVVTMSGWDKPADEFNRPYLDRLTEYSKEFGIGVKELAANYEKVKCNNKRVMCYRTKRDEFVPYDTAIVNGASYRNVATWNHVMAVAYGLVGYAWEIGHFIKEKV